MLINRLTVEKIVFYPYKGTLPRNKSGHSNGMHHRRISVFMLKFMLFFLKKKKVLKFMLFFLKKKKIARSQAKERILYLIPFV